MQKLILLFIPLLLLISTGCQSADSNKMQDMNVTTCKSHIEGIDLNLPNIYITIILNHHNDIVYEKKHIETYFCTSLSQALLYEDKLSASCGDDKSCYVERESEIITYSFTEKRNETDPKFYQDWDYQTVITKLENDDYICQEDAE